MRFCSCSSEWSLTKASCTENPKTFFPSSIFYFWNSQVHNHNHDIELENMSTFKQLVFFLTLLSPSDFVSTLARPCHLSTHHPDMEATTNSTADLLSDPLLWQNESFLLNTTAANTSVVYKPIIPPGLNKAINIILITTLSITMLSLGCIMEISKIKVTAEDVVLFKAFSAPRERKVIEGLCCHIEMCAPLPSIIYWSLKEWGLQWWPSTLSCLWQAFAWPRLVLLLVCFSW